MPESDADTTAEYPFEVWRWDVLNALAADRLYRRYLEIGFGEGVNFRRVRCPVKHAVDPYVPPDPDVVPVSSDHWFDLAARFGWKYDLIFVDGLHTADQVLRDYAGALGCLNQGGCLAFHDVNPTRRAFTASPEDFRRDGGWWTGDTFRAWCSIRLRTPYWTGTTLDEFGVGILDTTRPAKPLGFSEAPRNYEEFDSSRELYLGPVSLADLIPRKPGDGVVVS